MVLEKKEKKDNTLIDFAFGGGLNSKKNFKQIILTKRKKYNNFAYIICAIENTSTEIL